MVHFFHKIDGWVDFEDAYRSMVVEAPSPAHFVEVGAFLGKSTHKMPSLEAVHDSASLSGDHTSCTRGGSAVRCIRIRLHCENPLGSTDLARDLDAGSPAQSVDLLAI